MRTASRSRRPSSHAQRWSWLDSPTVAIMYANGSPSANSGSSAMPMRPASPSSRTSVIRDRLVLQTPVAVDEADAAGPLGHERAAAVGEERDVPRHVEPARDDLDLRLVAVGAHGCVARRVGLSSSSAAW